MTRHRGLLATALVLMGAPLLYAVFTFAARPEPKPPWLEPATSGTTCILPTARMRYDHMKHLKSLRDRVVREGRTAQVIGSQPQGITSCKGCHAHREQFCDRCHLQVSVAPDCFGCHRY